MVYIPRHVMQRDGSPWAGTNCLMASGATALDRHTQGAIQTSGADMRQRSGRLEPGAYSNFNDLAQAWASYGATLRTHIGVGWWLLDAALTEGRGVVLLGDYGVLPGRCSSYTGDHAVYVNSRDGTSYHVSDPLCPDWRWVSGTGLRAFGQQISNVKRTTVQFAFTDPDPAPVVTLPEVEVLPVIEGTDIMPIYTDPERLSYTVEPGNYHDRPDGAILGAITDTGARFQALCYSSDNAPDRWVALLGVDAAGEPDISGPTMCGWVPASRLVQSSARAIGDVAAAIAADRARARIVWG